MRSRFRSLLDRVRVRTRNTARLGNRCVRAFRYVLYLLLWSRFRGGGRTSLSSLLLHLKGLRLPPPALQEEGGAGAEEGFADGFAGVYGTLLGNLRTGDTIEALRHAVPGPAFEGVYLWDSAFIALIWKDWDAEVAGEVLRSVIDLRDGDRLQHFVAFLARSTYTQPPLLAWAAQDVARRMGPARRRAFLEEIYPPLAAYHRWLRAHRRLGSGLYAWEHPYESGMDNAPRFASRDERRLADTRRLAAPDFSTYAILQCEALARMAQRLEREDEAATFRARAGAIRDAMNERLWHEEDGLYYDRDERSGEWVRCAGITSLLPLAAGVPEGRRAERLRLRCEDPAAFATPLPFPSVARADAAFEKDMWRGPVWINTAYLALRGLDRYGWDRVWARLAWRLCAGVYRVYAAEGHFFEFYDPDAPRVDALRRKRGNAWKAFVLGRAPQKEFVGWSGLVNPLLLEMVFGTEEEEDGPLLLRPRFSPEAAGRRWRIELPQRRVTLALTVTEEGGVEGAAVAAGRAHPVAAGFAETVRVGAC